MPCILAGNWVRTTNFFVKERGKINLYDEYNCVNPETIYLGFLVLPIGILNLVFSWQLLHLYQVLPSKNLLVLLDFTMVIPSNTQVKPGQGKKLYIKIQYLPGIMKYYFRYVYITFLDPKDK